MITSHAQNLPASPVWAKFSQTSGAFRTIFMWVFSFLLLWEFLDDRIYNLRFQTGVFVVICASLMMPCIRAIIWVFFWLVAAGLYKIVLSAFAPNATW